MLKESKTSNISVESLVNEETHKVRRCADDDDGEYAAAFDDKEDDDGGGGGDDDDDDDDDDDTRLTICMIYVTA